MTLGKTRIKASRASNTLVSKKYIATRHNKERCPHDPLKGGENDGSISDKAITTENAQRTTRSEQQSNLEMDYQCVCGRRFTTKRGMKIHRTKMGCLNASTNQQQRTAQAGKTPENQSQVQNHSAEESDEEFRQLIKAKRQRINFPPASAKEQWEALDNWTSSSGRALWSTNLPLSVTLSTRHVLTPSGLNNIKPKENLRKIEGSVRWKPCESRRKT